jgi:purine-binding chemotaxis protein CheW
VVAHIGEARIGLAVDRIHAVLRIPQDTIDAVPSILNRGAGEAQIQSIHRSPDGRGIVSILSAERLFREDTVARLVAETRERDTGMGGPTQEKSTEQALVFQLGEEEFGLPIGAVREVVRLPEKITRIPRAPGFVKGVINHRGRMLPVIDQRRRFGLPGDRSTDRRRVIVTEIDGMQVGFLVDRVLEVLQLANGQVQPTPALGVEGSRLFDRVVTLNVGNRMLLLIDPRELLDRAERDLLASLEQREEDADAS